MHIGIVPVLSGLGGGVYQYSLTMLQALCDWKRNECEDEFIVFTYEVHHPEVMSLSEQDWVVKPIRAPSVKRKVINVLHRVADKGLPQKASRFVRQRLAGNESPPPLDVVRFHTAANRWFHQCAVDLMLYPGPDAMSFEAGIPYVMAIHDMQHRLQPGFPEFSSNGNWEQREYLLRNGARYATLILADSKAGKEDILKFYEPYGVTPDKVKILPFLPACYLAVNVPESERQQVRANYNLPKRYLFYPAQFWPHKNHARLLRALLLIKQKYHIMPSLVLCGTYVGEIRERSFCEFTSLTHQLGLENQVYYLGYVSDQYMAGLYAGAVALVMPTFFGPTNIPILEAWAFGCPVLTSDIRGIREQVIDAATLINPCSVDDIADGIYKLWTNESLRNRLADRGRQRLATYTFDDYRHRLINILEEAKARVL